MMLQSAYAGTVLTTAFKKTPFYAEFKPWLNAVGPWKDLAQLIATPLLMGALSFRPEALASPILQGMLVESLVPAVVAAKKRQQTQIDAMKELDQLDEAARNEVMAAIGWILGQEDDKGEAEASHADSTEYSEPVSATG